MTHFDNIDIARDRASDPATAATSAPAVAAEPASAAVATTASRKSKRGDHNASSKYSKMTHFDNIDIARDRAQSAVFGIYPNPRKDRNDRRTHKEWRERDARFYEALADTLYKTQSVHKRGKNSEGGPFKRGDDTREEIRIRKDRPRPASEQATSARPAARHARAPSRPSSPPVAPLPQAALPQPRSAAEQTAREQARKFEKLAHDAMTNGDLDTAKWYKAKAVLLLRNVGALDAADEEVAGITP